MAIDEPTAIIVASVPLAMITVGLVVVSYRQFVIERHKLRLELYNRRFAIYNAAMKIRRALEQKAIDGSEIEKLIQDFEYSRRESRFLFAEKDGVFRILRSMNDRASDALSLTRKIDKNKVAVITRSHAALSEGEAMKLDMAKSWAIREFRSLSFQLENKVDTYLDFRKII